MKHVISLQIRISDLDPFGHVNNGAQCHLYDFARTNYLETVMDTKFEWTEFDMVLVNINIDFQKQILIQENIVCKTQVYEIGNKSMKMRQCLVNSDNGEVKSICHSVMVGIDRDTDTSKPIPENYKKAISSFENLND